MPAALSRLLTLLTLLLSAPLFAAPTGNPSNYTSLPVTAVEATPPLLLIAMSRDHELFRKAYSDYSDIDGKFDSRGDGQIDTTYKDSIDYLGHFDSNFCYQYDNGKFSPIGQVDSGSHRCHTTDGWSGNFLNWASMTRIDLIRTVLYGGKRRDDPASSGAVLERELIPPDIHAFAKVYDGAGSGAIELADLVQGSPTNGAITLCNVSQWPASTDPNSAKPSGALSTTNYPPLLRVAYGDNTNVVPSTVGYPNWASTEVAQCQWNGTTHRDSALAQPDRPVGNDTNNSYKVLVERCVANQDGPVSSRCKRYDNGTPSIASDDLFKPVGLLQRYGERGQMRFGLMTGSYDNNSHGGVLRQGVDLLSEVNVATGQITAGSLIGTLDRLRIATYQMDFLTSSLLRYPSCNSYVSSAAVKNGSCADWGNPLGEIYLEAVRYLAGASSPSAAYLNTSNGNSDPQIPGLTRLTSWSDPYNFGPNDPNGDPTAVPCAQCAVLLISTSQGSFDSMRDAADWPSSGLPSGFAVSTATNTIQNKEGLDGASVLAGRVGTTSIDQECSPKTLVTGALDQTDGICPEAPSAEGGYGIAGLAYEAAIRDLRTGLSGTQKIKTFAVSVAEDLPSFTVTSGTQQAQIVPLCKSSVVLPDFQKCSLIDVVKEPPAPLPTECSGSSSYHRFLLTWEGTAWGSDYDFDMEQRLEYCEVSGKLYVRTAVTRDAASAEFEFGFQLVGTTDPDPLQSGNYPKEITVALNSNASSTPSSFREPRITGGGATLQKPLWLAAKYGGFNDLDKDGTPTYNGSSSDPREWDGVDNLSGAAGSDGVPDNYFQLRNPTSLEAALNRIFASVAGSVASGTAAAVVANNVSGEGAVYQALYHPRIEAGQNAITWAGTLHGLFIDSAGRLREDFGGNSPTPGNAKLDGCDVDPVVEIFFDSVNLPTGTKIRRYSGVTADCSNIKNVTPTVRPLTELKTLWNARDQLARAASHDPLMPQRDYDDIANTGRAIYTRDPAATDGTLSDFTSTDLASRYRELNPDTASADPQGEAANIINFIRGQEGITGYRSRTIDYDGSGTAKPWLLGDIINSSPVVVGAPNAGHDLRYGDSSYADFKAKYAKRRQVVYVGANDGMVHAFNGGFWDEANKQFATTGNHSEISHPLGAELWAYVPENLLPHLRWLTEPNYEHIFYVDGTAQSFDVKAFTADSDHPGGWGTILVIGMRFGGVPIDLDGDGDGTLDHYRSAYLVLDITNPEQPPKLVAELSDAQLGFTTALPALVRRPNNGWELLFGSGPTASTPLASADAVSSQNARLYRYDLVNKTFVTGFAPLDLGSTAATSFVGDLLAQDWNGDGYTDELYFGLVGGTAGSQSGGLYRADPDLGSVTPVIGTRPIIAAPMAVRDNAGKKWLYAGEGKLLAASDRNETGQNSFYGVLLDSSNTALLRTDQIQVANTGLLINSSGTATPLVDGTVTINDFNTLKNHISTNKKGWVYQLAVPPLSAPSARVINPATRAGSTLFFSDFLPPTGSSCDFGQSNLYGLDYQSGTAAPNAAFGNDPRSLQNALRLTLPYLSLGSGLSSKPVVYIGEGGKRSIITQQETGALTGSEFTGSTVSPGRKSWRRLPLR